MTQVAAPDHVGRHVRWRGQPLFCPPSAGRPGAPVVDERIEVEPGVMEVGHGVPVRPGDHGEITDFLGVTQLGDRCYQIIFANGATFPLPLPDSLVDFPLIEVMDTPR